MSPRFPPVRSPEELLDLVTEVGFLPFFANPIPGFSVEECCPKELWFAKDTDGPWEWKGPTARSGRCVYGKLFQKKAGFVSREWFPDLANFRRDGYDFDARFDDGLAPIRDRDLYDAVASRGAVLSPELKELCGREGFDTSLTRLQMQTYLCVADFVYSLDRHGRPYGWGVARFTTPEALLGPEPVTSAYGADPRESRERILSHLRALLPNADSRRLEKLLG